MSYKLTCPACDRYTSAVFTAYADGLPCPHCGAALNTPETVAAYYAQLPDDHHWTVRTPQGTSAVVYKGGKRPNA